MKSKTLDSFYHSIEFVKDYILLKEKQSEYDTKLSKVALFTKLYNYYNCYNKPHGLSMNRDKAFLQFKNLITQIKKSKKITLQITKYNYLK